MKVLAIIVNIFFPGIGTLIIQKWGQGIVQVILSLIAWFLILSQIGIFIGGPLGFITWIWAIISVANHQQDPINVVVQEASFRNQEGFQTTSTHNLNPKNNEKTTSSKSVMSKSEAAAVIGVTDSMLNALIRSGRISVNPNGSINASALTKAGFKIKNSLDKEVELSPTPNNIEKPSTPTNSAEDRLKTLADLKSKGLIDEEEFQRKRKVIIATL